MPHGVFVQGTKVLYNQPNWFYALMVSCIRNLSQCNPLPIFMVLYRFQSLHCTPCKQVRLCQSDQWLADTTIIPFMWRVVYTVVKEKSLRFRMSERRYNNLKLYAEWKEKTMTQLIEDWVDRLPTPEIGDSSTTPRTE